MLHGVHAMRFRARRSLLLFFLSAAAACSNATSGGPSSSGTRDLLTLDQIQETRLASAFEVVQRLRPNWLRMRATTVPGGGEPLEISVYVDNVRFGGVEALRGMSTESVERMQWIDGPSATQRWGTGNAAGAILVTTRGAG